MASIRRLPDGRYQGQFRPVPGGKQVTRTSRRKADVQRWLNEQTAAVVTGQYVDPVAGKITFSGFYALWAERQVWASGTRRAMDLAAGAVTFADVPLRLLRRSHVEDWVKAMQTADRGPRRERGLAPGTIRTRFNNVRTVLRAAVADRRITTDPSEGVRLPRGRRAEAAMLLPTVDQVRDLLDAADAGFRPFVALCAFAGLRLGEAAAVQLGDVDAGALLLHVRRQVQRAKGAQVEITPPKYGSERTVFIPVGLAAMLNEHIERTRERRQDLPWLFLGAEDLPPHQNTVGYWWHKTRAAAGVPTMHLHDLRHFFASGLIAAGCDVVTVQRALGHSSPTVTLRTYAHLWPDAADRTRTAAQGLMTNVGVVTNG